MCENQISQALINI